MMEDKELWEDIVHRLSVKVFKQITEKRGSHKILLIKKSKESDYRDLMYKIEGLKELTGHINFGCDFKNNKCLRYLNIEKLDHPASCCSNCAHSIGYLMFIPEVDINIVVDSYDNKTGFWRIDKGCLLPRRLRSLECVTYSCSAEVNILVFRQILKAYEERLVKNYGEPIK